MSDFLDLEDGLAYDPILFTFLFSDYPSACSPDSAYGTDIEDLPTGFDAESAAKFLSAEVGKALGNPNKEIALDDQNNIPASERRAEVIDGITKVEQVLGENGFRLPTVKTNPLIVKKKVLPAADFEPFLGLNKFGAAVDSVLIENSLHDFSDFTTRGYLDAEVFGITTGPTDTELEIFGGGKGIYIPTTPIPAKTLFPGESKLTLPTIELVHKADVQDAKRFSIKRKNEDDGYSRAEGSHCYKRRCNHGAVAVKSENGDDERSGAKRGRDAGEDW